MSWTLALTGYTAGVTVYCGTWQSLSHMPPQTHVRKAPAGTGAARCWCGCGAEMMSYASHVACLAPCPTSTTTRDCGGGDDDDDDDGDVRWLTTEARPLPFSIQKRHTSSGEVEVACGIDVGQNVRQPRGEPRDASVRADLA